MYVAYILQQGKRTKVGTYDSVTDFLYDYPRNVYYVIGKIIYIID